MSENAVVNTQIQNHFWNKLTQFKFDLVLYSLYFSECVTYIRLIKITCLTLSAIFTGIWMNWGDNQTIKVICAVAIFVLQIANTLSENLPFENRKKELRELELLQEPIYTEMESDWFRIVNGDFTHKEIEDKLVDYERKRRDIKQHYFREDAIPRRKRIEDKARAETDLYITTNFYEEEKI